MPLKKLFFIIFSLLAFVSITTAQQKTATSTAKQGKFYIKAYGGYGILTPGSFKLTNQNITAFSVSSTGLGAGWHFGGGIGFILNDFINLGVDGDYLSGKDLTASSDYAGVYGMSHVDNTVTSSVLSIIPNIVFKAISTESYYIYNRIGVILAVSTKTALNASSKEKLTFNPYPNETKNSNTTFSYGLNGGLQAALGIQFGITDHLRGFGELVAFYLPISPSSATTNTTTYNYDIANNPIPPPNDKVTSTSEVSYVTSGNNSATPPQLAKSSFNVNYIGINIGLVYKF